MISFAIIYKGKIFHFNRRNDSELLEILITKQYYIAKNINVYGSDIHIYANYYINSKLFGCSYDHV
jgi:hypothetical protein